jgi:hypothetical protein
MKQPKLYGGGDMMLLTRTIRVAITMIVVIPCVLVIMLAGIVGIFFGTGVLIGDTK